MSSQADTIARAAEQPSDAEIQSMLAQAVRSYAARAAEIATKRCRRFRPRRR